MYTDHVRYWCLFFEALPKDHIPPARASQEPKTDLPEVSTVSVWDNLRKQRRLLTLELGWKRRCGDQLHGEHYSITGPSHFTAY